MGKTFADYGIDIEPGQHRARCPECSPGRKKQYEKCLSVDQDKGVWYCHHCGWHGGLGGTDKEREYASKAFTLPEFVQTDVTDEKVLGWFRSRGIGPRTIAAFHIKSGIATMHGKGGWEQCMTIQYPYYLDGKVVNVKYRTGDKRFRQEKGARKCLYNFDMAKASKYHTLIVTEGEMDCMALYEAGFMAVVSVPDGAPNPDSQSFTSKFDFLDGAEDLFAQFKNVLLAVDNDAPGIRLRDELARRIGYEKCKKWLMPEGCKDANDVLAKHGTVGLQRCVAEAQDFPVACVKSGRDLWDAVFELHEKPERPGLDIGWANAKDVFNVEVGQMTIVTGIPSHGKALDINTPVPTPKGFVTMGNLTVGDTVFDENGNECKITRVSGIQHDRPCYKLKFDDGTEIIADADHQWLTISEKARRSARMSQKKRGDREETKLRGTDQRWKKTYPSVVTTAEIANSILSQGKFNHQISLAKAFEGTNSELPVLPYTLGVWLGNGNSSNGGITQKENEVIPHLLNIGETLSKQLSDLRYTIIGLVPKIRDLGLINNKHIPEMYLFASKKDRIELLRGLMDTDGYCAKDGVCEYTSIKKELAEDVLTLVSSLGIKARMIVGDATLNGRIISKKYRICFTERELPVFYVQEKLERQRIGIQQARYHNRTIISCEPVESRPVCCIEVDSPNHLFLVTKKFVPTHNSSFIDALRVNMFRHHGWRSAAFSPENWPAQNHLATLIEMLSGRNFYELLQDDVYSYMELCKDAFYFIQPDHDEDMMTVDKILQSARALVYRHGVNLLVIDPWNEIEHKMEYNQREDQYISVQLAKIRRFARTNGIHIFVIAHPRQLEKDKSGNFPPPTAYDIAGGAMWRNKADNILCVYRPNMLTSETEVYVQKIRFRRNGKAGACMKFTFHVSTSTYHSSLIKGEA